MTSARSFFLRPATTNESHRVTTFELFFDLVFVFAFTQVTGYMATSHSAIGVLQGIIILATLWWTWSAYAWLANQTRVDEGLARLVLSVALVLMFVIALVIPEAFVDLPGGLFGPIVFVVCYLAIRVLHGLLYLAAAGDDAGLRRQVITGSAALAASLPFLVAGALLGSPYQVWLWIAALAVDFLLTYLLAFEGGWQVKSAAHWSERFGLVIILALGESIVSIGVGAARAPISWPIVAGTVLAITLSICLWWLYFDIVAIVAEKVLKKLPVGKRSKLATDAYTYIHFLLIAGIIVSALGIETVIAEIGAEHPFGPFGACALYGGTSLYLAAHALFWRRMIGEWRALRLVGGAVLLALIPVGAALPPLIALALAVAVTVTVVAIETVRNREVRARLRAGD